MSAALAAFILGLIARDLWPFARRKLNRELPPPERDRERRPRRRLPR